MTTPNGYNNPAYCHQYDSSLYDYQYVAEIDPSSPNLSEESNRRQIKLIPPNYETGFLTGSDGFGESDESNGSIIIEECNNRRVTLICEKRNQTEVKRRECNEEQNRRADYYQDVSLESENGYDDEGNEAYLEGRSEDRNRCRRRSSESQTEQKNSSDQGRNYFRVNNNEKNLRYPPQRHHRYEEIPGDDESVHNISNGSTSVHRYAEISSDENGYPTLKKAIEIPKSNEGHPFDGGQNVTAKIRSKPKAISPVKYWTNYPPPSTPSRAHQRNPYSKALELSPSGSGQNSPSHGFYSDTSIRTDSFEMSELSPPRSWDVPRCSGKEQTFFMSSPKRQPPIGASAANELQEPFFFNAKCILPSHLQKNVSRVRKERSRSVPSSPGRTQIHLTPNKTHFDKKMMQIFHIKSNKSKSRETTLGENGNTVRRNISNSFSEPPEKQLTPKKKTVEISKMASRSPYKPTTVEIVQPKTAVITPIFQRKNHQSREEDRSNASTKRNFEKMSKTFQSTGNIFRPTKEQIYSGRIEDRLDYSQEKSYSARLKRNQSVPNFAQTFVIESGTMMRKPSQVHYKEDHGQTRTMNWQYSPKKPFGNASPIDKSRISLIDQSRSSFSNADSDYYPRCSTCFIIATVVHLITATATCAISFYLLSKIGRRYYLDFGIMAGFVNFTLGLLGFRSYCWRWLPNRNYVSGFIALAVFSLFTCAGLSYLIIVKPMGGDPILDVTGGAICAVSVLTILLALTGLTMSGCCKTPPPDNRVGDV